MSALKEKAMAAQLITEAVAPDREIITSRLFDAPREVVWEAFTDPRQVVQWWGPNGFTTTIDEMDVRPGGKWRHTMHGPDGTNYPNASVFKEVVKPERIVYGHGGGKEGGPGASFEATWTFEAQGKKTLLTGRMVFPTAAARELVVKEYGAIEGAKQTFARLAEYLDESPVVIERIYGVPINIVWKAITEIDQMKQWYMPVIPAFEARVGFETRFSVTHEGAEFPHIWKVTEVVPGKKIAYTWQFPGHPGESLATFELFAEGESTRLKLTHSGLETHGGKTYEPLSRKNFNWGWNELGMELEKFLARDEAFVITRTFDAPRELVWQVWTDPKHLSQWWGPSGLTMAACKVDLRPGGLFHYGMKTPDGHEMWGKFVYKQIDPPKKLVLVVSFSDAQGGTTRHPMNATWPLEVLNTMTLAEESGKTQMTLHGIPINATPEEHQTFKAGHSSMQQGFAGTMNQLAEYLAKVQAQKA
jgi:uncharacterized protein YndB with AHSA1/START domain